MPQKTWVIGEEVLAADFNTYVQNQVIPRFATVAARDTQWPAASAGNGAYCDTADTGAMWRSNGTVWQVVKGRVAYTQTVTGVSSITGSFVDLISVSWTADPVRSYRVSAYMPFYSSVANDVCNCSIRNAAGTVFAFNTVVMPVAGQYGYGMPVKIETGLTGSQTRKITVYRSAGSGTITAFPEATNPGFIMVEDVG